MSERGDEVEANRATAFALVWKYKADATLHTQALTDDIAALLDAKDDALTDTRRRLDEARRIATEAFGELRRMAARPMRSQDAGDVVVSQRVDDIAEEALEALARLDPASTPVAGEACRCMKGDGHEPHPGRTCGRMVDLEDFEAPCRCKGAPTPDTKGAP